MPNPRNNPHSSEPTSELVQLFVERSAKQVSLRTPGRVIEALVDALPAMRIRNQQHRIDRALKDRNVTVVNTRAELECDGVLEPLGTKYADGFRMWLKRSDSAVRMRFSLAHEICHTFFYETVPELKFQPHNPDDEEEKLCNAGAAALLVPSRLLRASAKSAATCIGSLQGLAEDYSVSIATMLIRLRSLGLWNCELSQWRLQTNGSFALHRMYGGRQCDWQWQDPSALERAWNSNESFFGTGFVYAVNGRGARRYRPVSYNLRRHGNEVLVLWGTGITRPSKTRPLLKAIQDTVPTR